MRCIGNSINDNALQNSKQQQQQQWKHHQAQDKRDEGEKTTESLSIII